MNEAKIAEYRAEAAACAARAAEEYDIESKTRWTRLAQDWSKLADNLAGKNDGSRPSP